MRIDFQEVAIRRQKTVVCSGGCGRRLKRSKKFWQTINPWNQKTPDQIRVELGIDADVWASKSEICRACADDQ